MATRKATTASRVAKIVISNISWRLASTALIDVRTRAVTIGQPGRVVESLEGGREWLNCSSHQCPSGLGQCNQSSIHIRTCCITSDAAPVCSESILFHVHSSYSKVCGKIQGYQFGSPSTFANYCIRGSNPTIEGNYVDGVSLTHGHPRHPRQHIWTFAAALDEVGTLMSQYTCTAEPLEALTQ